MGRVIQSRAKKSNNQINLPTLKEGEEKIYNLFHCFNCEIHSQVISEILVKGNDNYSVVNMEEIIPYKIISYSLGGSFPSLDSEVIETFSFGRCGMSGEISEVPKFILKLNEKN